MVGVVSLTRILSGSVGTPASGATCSCEELLCCRDTPLEECLAGTPSRAGGGGKSDCQRAQDIEQDIADTMQ